jgi:hypothetical protein
MDRFENTKAPFPLVFPTGVESDHGQSVVHSTSNATTMVTLEHCVTSWTR